ncbi:gp53-like domain-containing protein [Burkholderia cenocepacia]
MPGPFIFANNVSTTLAGAISSTSTTVTLSSAANLPSSIPAGKMLVITLNDQATRQTFEVMYATAISGATLTVLRGQEGTAALAWSAGDFAYCAPSMGQMQAFGQLADANTWTGNNTFTNPLAVAAAVAAGQAVNLGQFQSGSAGIGIWMEFPNGWIVQIGTSSVGTPSNVTFPRPFPNSCFGMTVSESAANSSTWGAGLPTVHGYQDLTRTGYRGWASSWTGSGWAPGSFSQTFIAFGN